MRSIFILVLLCLMCGVSPGSARIQTVVAGAELRATGPVADSLRAFALEMAALLRQRDVPAIVALYGDTLHFVHVEEAQLVPWSRLASMMRTYLAGVESNPITVVGEPGVTLVDADNAIVYVTHRAEGEGRSETHTGVWTGVLHRFPDGWRIVHSHSSDQNGGG